MHEWGEGRPKWGWESAISWSSGSQFSRPCTNEVKGGQNEAEKAPSAEVQVVSLVVHAGMRWRRSKWGWETPSVDVQVVSLVVHAGMRWREAKMRSFMHEWGEGRSKRGWESAFSWRSGSQFSRPCTNEVTGGQNEVQVVTLVIHAPQNVKILFIHVHIRWIPVEQEHFDESVLCSFFRLCVRFADIIDSSPLVMRGVNAPRRVNYEG